MSDNEAHARFGPSSAKRWMRCPASIRICEAHVAKFGRRPSGPAAEFGTACHKAAERVLQGTQALAALPAEQQFHVVPYTKHVDTIFDALHDAGQMSTTTVEFKLQTGIEDCWGTADIGIDADQEVWIGDLKTGRELVDAEANEQLLTYAIGIAKRNKRAERFNLFIAQAINTECPIATWTCDRNAVMKHRKAVQFAIHEADRACSPVPGDHCLWCDGKASCPAHHTNAVSVFHDAPETKEALPAAVAAMPDDQRIFIIRNKEQIERFMKAVVAEAIRCPPAGYKAVAGGSRRCWIDDDDAVLATLQNYDIAPRVSPVTLGEAQKTLTTKLGKALADAALADITEKPPGKPTLAPTTDPRPAINAGAIFIEEDSNE